jgi:hypothetical protein
MVEHTSLERLPRVRYECVIAFGCPQVNLITMFGQPWILHLAYLATP